MYRIGIYSLDKSVLDTLESLIIAKYHVKVYKYVSENELWQDYEGQSSFSDIIIIDMQKSNRCALIENRSNTLNNFEIEPVYLLQKPLEREKFYCAMDYAIQKLYDSEMYMLKLHFKGRRIYILYDEIIYIESDRRYILVHQENKTDRAMLKLSDLMQKLPEYFIRCHQSYIVNIHKIMYCEGNKIVLKNGEIVFISRKRFRETREAIDLYYGIPE